MIGFANKTVLLVEDDPNDIFLIRRAFGRADIKNSLQVVEDGEAALQYLQGEEPYSDRELYPLPMLMILDLKLPRKSGLEVLTWLRQQPSLKCLPVVVLTSSQENKDVNQAYHLGANSYLVKPVDFKDLLELIKTLNLYWFGFNEIPTVMELD